METRRPWPLLLLALAVGCDGSIDVRGRVVDDGGEPVAGGKVTLAAPGESLGFEAETDGDGCFAIGGMVSPGERDYLLTISATGREPFEGTFRSTGGYAVLVDLAPAGSRSPSAATRFDSPWPEQLESCSG